MIERLRHLTRVLPSTASAAGIDDADLARLAAAWPHLLDNVKAAILAMIETADE